jgi:hypothetical protein
MPDPYVRRIGEVFDIDERTVIIGVDYDTVSIRVGGMEARFACSQVGELFHALFEAAWEAGAASERMRAEVDPEEAAEALAALRTRLAGDDGL